MSIGQPQEITGDKPVALYRLYDSADALLYVGITHSPSDRFSQHAKDKEWWPEVTRKTVAWCADRREAEAAESAAIASEKPRHNKAPGIYVPAVDDLASLRAEIRRLTGRIAVLEREPRQVPTEIPPATPRKSPIAQGILAQMTLAIRDQIDESVKDPAWVKGILKRHHEYAARQARPEPAEYCAADGTHLACIECEPQLFGVEKHGHPHEQATTTDSRQLSDQPSG